MKRLLISLGLVGLIAATAITTASGHTEGKLRASFVPCSPAICGGFPQNEATLSVKKATVRVAHDGVVRIKLHQLRELASGSVAANKTLEVHFGSFGPGTADFVLLGTITVDDNGNFKGTIDTGTGEPFAFPDGATISGQFALNDPLIRTEFVTGLLSGEA